MKYSKICDANYIICFGVGSSGEEITEAEYKELERIVSNIPHTIGKGYRLRTDLTWEEYDLPPVPPPDPEEEVTEDEIGRAMEEIL